MKPFKNKLISGALVLSVSGVITKLIGAFYRVPLTNLLGAEGMGLYQMVFPLYTILLTFSSTGAPSGISKLIASGEKPEVALKSSLKLFSLLGAVGTLLMAIFCLPVATLQGNSKAWLCYLALSPSVFLVSVISCFRGYFQGLVNMRPTGISQIVEQLVKLFFGLSFAYFIKGSILLKAGACALSVTISELVALVYIYAVYKPKTNVSLKRVNLNLKAVVKTVLPIMLASLVMPLIRTVDSFLILNLVKTDATKNFGLYSGVVESLVSVPVTVCYSISVTSIPLIAKQNGTSLQVNSAFNSLALTSAIASLFGVATFMLSNFVINFLYGGLSVYEKAVSISMLKTSAISVVLLPIMQTLVASVNAMGKAKVSIIALCISGAIKTAVSFILLKRPQIQVFGAIYSDISCYFVACFIILGYIIYIKLKQTEKVKNNARNNSDRAWRKSKRFVRNG